MGASGIQTDERANADGTKTLSFRGEDIHDFAWAASPHFLVADDSFVNSLGPVKLHALVLASHAAQTQRYLSVLKQSMQKFDEWYGPYPYKQMTLIDPEPDSEIGGMEYPTLITGGTDWWSPHGSLRPGATVAHEYGHQYWYGMVATNEFEEPWLDEGINSYSESKVMTSLSGRIPPHVNARTLYASDAEIEGLFYIPHPDEDPIVRPGWKFASSAATAASSMAKPPPRSPPWRRYSGRGRFVRLYASTSPATALTTPPGPIFWILLKRFPAVKIWSLTLPRLSTAPRCSTTPWTRSPPSPSEWWKGRDANGPYHTSVMVRRKGRFVFPVNLEVGFDDGSKEQATWDGKDRWARFSWDKPSRAVYAQVDPDGMSRWTQIRSTTVTRCNRDRTARLKLTNYWVLAQQLLAQWLSFLV